MCFSPFSLLLHLLYVKKGGSIGGGRWEGGREGGGRLGGENEGRQKNENTTRKEKENEKAKQKAEHECFINGWSCCCRDGPRSVLVLVGGKKALFGGGWGCEKNRPTTPCSPRPLLSSFLLSLHPSPFPPSPRALLKNTSLALPPSLSPSIYLYWNWRSCMSRCVRSCCRSMIPCCT